VLLQTEVSSMTIQIHRQRAPRVILAHLVTLTMLSTAILACDPYVVGERAAVYNVTETSMYFTKNASSPGWAGSTTKILTLYTALWAISRGHASLTDEVAISERAQAQDCQCLERVMVNGQWESGTVVGERFLLGDLLVGIAWSAGEATDAVAEHIAAKFLHGGVPASSWAQSEEYMREFLALSNFLAYNDIGATDTWQASVHGGNGCDFSIGCWDEYNNLCAYQTPCGHRTTARDLAVMWKNAAALQPMFIQILGYKSYTLYSKTDRNSEIWNKQYPLMNRGGWYTGWQGDKNGSGGTVAAQATRCGRTLVAVSMNAADDVGVAQEDVVRLFDHAYDYYCNLRVKLAKALSSAAIVAMAATSPGGRVARAEITEHDTLDVTVWTDPSEVAESSATGIQSAPSPGCASCEPEDLLTAAFLDDGMLATAAVEWDKRVRLSIWSVDEPIGAGLQVAHVMDVEVPGLHETARLVALDPSMLLLATRDARGGLSLQTYAAKPEEHELVPLSQSPPGGQAVTAFEIAAGGGGTDADGVTLPWVVLATVEDADTANVSQWEIQPGGGITHIGDSPIGDATGTSIAATGTPSSPRFVTASIQGTAGVGGLQLASWSPASDGPQLVQWLDASALYATATGATAIVPITDGGAGGVSTFHRSAVTGRVIATTWDISDSDASARESRLSRTSPSSELAEGLSAVTVEGTDEVLVSSHDASGQHALVAWELGAAL
jgi:D-alanyl-D-alanine carboxypeptidase